MTERFGLLGHPVEHSLSPVIHRAAYVALGLSHHYELIDCPDEATVREAVDGLRRGRWAGLNVTLPWKQLALELADEVEPTARETGAANVLAVAGERVVGHNTDVVALADELARLAPGATQALVIGAGGAALAAVGAGRLRGLRRIGVVARRFSDARPEDAWPNREALASSGAELLVWPDNFRDESLLADFAAKSDIVVQATSAGMLGGAPGSEVAEIVPWGRLPSSALAYDVVYTPAVTPFLAMARQHGLTAEGGLGMLVGQAALAIGLWLGLPAPLRQMHAAARAALDEREGRT